MPSNHGETDEHRKLLWQIKVHLQTAWKDNRYLETFDELLTLLHLLQSVTSKCFQAWIPFMCSRAIWIQLVVARNLEFAQALHQEYKESFVSYRLSLMSQNMSLMIQAVEFHRPQLLKSLSPSFCIHHSTVGADWVHSLVRAWFSPLTDLPK